MANGPIRTLVGSREAFHDQAPASLSRAASLDALMRSAVWAFKLQLDMTLAAVHRQKFHGAGNGKGFFAQLPTTVLLFGDL